jgi:2-succinyl-5-enolpyruvyl-6-hydroxy-3-cyclohexene-1-carboxylate synthase
VVLGAGVTRLIIGDLALLHDAASLALPEFEPHPRIVIICGNDGGGTIFDTLEAADTAPADEFDRVMFTPQSVKLNALAAAYGWSYVRAENRGELANALAAPVAGPTLLEVKLSR